MASEADSSSYVASTTQESTRTRGPTSAVWAYSRTALDGEDPAYKYCIPCTEENIIPIFKVKGVPTNLRSHLKSKHSIFVDVAVGHVQATALQQLRELYTRAESSGQTEEIDAHIFSRQLDPDVVNEALISLIVVRNLPFRVAEWPEFHAFCQVLNPQSKGIVTTAHSQVTKKIRESWNCHKDTVRRTLQSAISSIHISLDIWTSPNGYLLLGICAHYTTHSLKKQKALLALRQVAGHSGENQFDILFPVLEDYGIVRQLGAIVADNASPNNTLCNAIENYMRDEQKIEWNAEHWRIRCNGHIINHLTLLFKPFCLQTL